MLYFTDVCGRWSVWVSVGKSDSFLINCAANSTSASTIEEMENACVRMEQVIFELISISQRLAS